MKRRAPQSEFGSALRSSFAQNLRLFRRKKGMTQDDLASAAGLGRTFINQVERGRSSVTLETIAALSMALGISPTVLIRPNSALASVPATRRRVAERPAIGMAEAAPTSEPELVGDGRDRHLAPLRFRNG